MKIWVDADACPVVIKDILFKAAQRTGIAMTLVANQAVPVPKIKNVSFIRVSSGFEVADNEIMKRMQSGDLIITNDIPLAADAIEKGGLALSPRGELYTLDNIKARLSMRNFMQSLRSGGVDTGGPPPLDQRDRKAFGAQLDKFLNKYINSRDSL